jgi:hypothetical protein
MSDNLTEKKILRINPELFSFSKNTTRKKRQSAKMNIGGKIKMKNEIKQSKPANNDSLKKKSILKIHLRNKL